MSENWKLRLVNFSLPCKSTTTTWRVLPPTIYLLSLPIAIRKRLNKLHEPIAA